MLPSICTESKEEANFEFHTESEKGTYEVSHDPRKRPELGEHPEGPLVAVPVWSTGERADRFSAAERVQRDWVRVAHEEISIEEFLDHRLHTPTHIRITTIPIAPPKPLQNTHSHNLSKHIPDPTNLPTHPNNMLLNVHLMQIRCQVQTLLIADLDVRDVQRVDDGLDRFGLRARCGGEREHAEVRVLGHHVADNLGIGVVACAFVRLVCNDRRWE